MVNEEGGMPEIEEEESSGGESSPKTGGGFPKWAIWTIVAVAVVAIIGIAVGVTLALSGGGEGNKPPVITTLMAVPPVVSSGGYSTVTCVASDPEGSTLSYAWTATGGTISGIGNIVSWIPPNVTGTFSVGVSVSDGEGGTTNGSVAVTVGVSTSTPTPTPTLTATPTPTITSAPTPTSTAVTYGSISINSTPSSADIYIDSVKNSNVTPSTIIHVTAGSHSVRLVSTGYWREEIVQVYGGETTDINWGLYTVHDYEPCALYDAYVNNSEPGTNYNTDTLSVAGNSTRMFAQFNLGSINSTAVILSANLSFYYYDNESTATSGPVGAYRVTGSWDEDTITWNNSPAVQSTSISTITVSPTIIGGYLTWSISSLVQDWVDGSITNYGLMLKDTNEATLEGYKLFYSSEGAQCPKLTISYYDPAE